MQNHTLNDLMLDNTDQFSSAFDYKLINSSYYNYKRYLAGQKLSTYWTFATICKEVLVKYKIVNVLKEREGSSIYFGILFHGNTRNHYVTLLQQWYYVQFGIISVIIRCYLCRTTHSIVIICCWKFNCYDVYLELKFTCLKRTLWIL